MHQGTTTAASGAPSPITIDHQQAIENSLVMALHYVRSDGPDMLHRAIAKAQRALTLLKRAREASNDSGRA